MGIVRASEDSCNNAAWRREYNEERPKKGLGGLTPAAYARRLAETESRMTLGL